VSADDTRVKIGQIIDSLGVTSSISGEDMVTDVVVLSKVVEPDGKVRLNACWSDGMSWIERLGMLHAATAMETPPFGSGNEDDGSGS